MLLHVDDRKAGRPQRGVDVLDGRLDPLRTPFRLGGESLGERHVRKRLYGGARNGCGFRGDPASPPASAEGSPASNDAAGGELDLHAGVVAKVATIAVAALKISNLINLVYANESFLGASKWLRRQESGDCFHDQPISSAP